MFLIALLLKWLFHNTFCRFVSFLLPDIKLEDKSRAVALMLPTQDSILLEQGVRWVLLQSEVKIELQLQLCLI